MSDPAAVRTAISAAASTVPWETDPASFLNCSPYFRQTTKPGDAMVRRDRTLYPNPFGGIVYWQVIIILPSSLSAAEAKLDLILPALISAVETELVIDSVTPQQLALDSGLIPVVILEGHREE